MEVESKSIVDTPALEVDSLVEIYLSSLIVGNRTGGQLKKVVPEDKLELDGRPAAQSPSPLPVDTVHAATNLPIHTSAILPDTTIPVSDTASKASNTRILPLKDKHGDVDDWDGVDERDCYITIKVVPDTFSLPNEQHQQLPPPDGRGGVHRTMMHYYKVVVRYKDDRLFAVGGSTSELLYGSMKALNDIGLAFRRKLSDDLLENGYDLFIMDVMLEMRILYMGEYAVSTPVMTQMQRFHKAVMSQEDTTECSDAAMQDRYFPLAFDFSCHGSSVEWPVSDEDWCRSGNGSHYVVFPFKGGCYDPVGMDIVDDDDDAVFDLVHLTRCADNAQLTVHNLRVAALSNTSPEGSEIVNADDSCSVLPQHSFTHLLVLANNVSLGCIATDNVMNSKKLQDLFRVVKVSSLTDLDAATLVKEGSRRWEGAEGGERRVAITFADYFLSKRPHLADAIVRAKLDPRHHLVAMNSISTKVAHRNLLTTMQDDTRELPGWKNRNSVFSNKPERVHFMPEQCRPIGYGHWFYMMKVLPSVVHRVQSVELAVEARNLVFRSASRVCMAEPSLSTWVVIDPQERYVRLLTFLEAMTPKMSLESFDSERLEILGDSFLKFAITVDLFKKRPHNNEGLLTSERVLFISNRRLCAAAIESNLAAYIRALPLSFGPQKICITPPGMCSGELMKARSVWNADVMKYPAEFKYDADMLFRYPVRHHERHMVMFKKLADMVESVIGAFYVDGGKEAGVLALKSFGLWPDATPLPPPASTSTPSAVKTEPSPVRTYSENVLKRLSSVPIRIVYSSQSSATMIDGGEMKGDSAGYILEEAEVSKQCSEQTRSTMVDFREAKYLKFADLEHNLGYSFENKAILLEALTHSSVCSGPNYERLEFLGDAVLDLLLVTHVYRWCSSKLSPDQIHVRKSTATCNHNLAILGCQVQLHRYIVHNSPAVQLQLVEYESKYHSKKLQAKRCKDDADWTEFEREDSIESNVLADAFEAVMGAIFLDAKEDLDTVNRIVTRLGLFASVVAV